ncbi:MAG: hypothetical protein V1862_03570 [Methanobacteriota archaeon]
MNQTTGQSGMKQRAITIADPDQGSFILHGSANKYAIISPSGSITVKANGNLTSPAVPKSGLLSVILPSMVLSYHLHLTKPTGYHLSMQTIR